MTMRVSCMLLLVIVLCVISAQLRARSPREFDRWLARRQNEEGRSLVSGEDLEVGMLAPNISVTRADRSIYDTTVLRGRRVAILFLTACGDCVADCLTAWQQLEKNQPGLTAIVISESPPGRISKLAAQHKISIPIVYDKNLESASSYRIKWGPRAYVVNESGRVEYVQPSMLACDEIASGVGQALSKEEDDVRATR